jgi:putative endonuclease
MYILEYSDNSYYTGSTNDLALRLKQHENGVGANHSKKRLPVKLLYTEEFPAIEAAHYREKQVQGWSRKKITALIKGDVGELTALAKNHTPLGNHSASADTNVAASEGSANENPVASAGSATEKSSSASEALAASKAQIKKDSTFSERWKTSRFWLIRGSYYVVHSVWLAVIAIGAFIAWVIAMLFI